MSRITIQDLSAYKSRGERFAMLTAYDYLTATIFDKAGIPLILVGDTLGIFVQGHDTTLPVTMDAMIYHCEIVVRAVSHALVIGDLPFGSYDTPEEGICNAGRLLKETGVQAVKLEGRHDALIQCLTQNGIPVIGHLGLTPQSYHQLSGNKVQARTKTAVEMLIQDALALENAGVFALLLEAIPSAAAKAVTEALKIPTIGIGAGPDCDGQVLVSTDMLGLHSEQTPRFVKQYAQLHPLIATAAERFAAEVRAGVYPGTDYAYNWTLK
ncbi:3-methyl-2-oxobutanoate hydroxymethyltransferase [Leptolyngbya sp. Heron Island J]|uniref:3-methyl-2-oxobutanoate hydroxymethyltransferase n=1 Tax=Leptolyngbya sp. Heron Island J TaxID=1385935 RepID=UPI0003B9C211|nr:3-methyl-2-oxobutanoate hydroxymethyltransferase [Leptolyngbya sp. Heron Island J]ESA33184.1 3-methyl-2-oxobutanoate hydroxymethyltransferase [Leptolyngbya sp. Heron Island J]